LLKEKDTMKLDPQQTADALPYQLLAQEIERLLVDTSVVVPPRLVQRLSDQSSLFVMPASDTKLAITKLITWVADNPLRGLPSIQGEVMVFDVRDGRRLCLLDGPTVTAHRTAAVSLLAAQKLAPNTAGKLLLVGAGVQARAHLHAFVHGLGVKEVVVSSRTRASAQLLVDEAQAMGLQAQIAESADDALADCSLVVSATSAQQIALRARPREDAFVCAIGAFTPAMVEWAPEVCAYMAKHGRVYVDTRDADHEAGDLLQAGLDVTTFPTLQALVRGEVSGGYSKNGPVFFKSCGWAGWDLAAARCVVGLLLG
jgi:1-piperideine-2-carboxylate/1-pyrroline-2-carboxylate reductase [NAD(P)H]